MQHLRTIGKNGDEEWGIRPDDLRDDDTVAIYDDEVGRVVAINQPAIVDEQYPEAIPSE